MSTTMTMTWNSYGNSSTRDKRRSQEEEEAFFDFYTNYVVFLDKIPTFWNQSQFGLAQHQYSTVVISIGVWELSAGRCSNLTQVRDDLLRALNGTRDFVWQYNNNPSPPNSSISSSNNNTATSTKNRPLTVFWKTHGMATRLKRGRLRECGDMIHTITREWFLSETAKTTTTTMTRRNVLEKEMEQHHIDPNDPHMILVDFALQVEPRTYSEKRIEGDAVYHFGQEARTLSLQLLSHQMHKSICRKKNNNLETNMAALLKEWKTDTKAME
jgi:hypothetical protein